MDTPSSWTLEGPSGVPGRRRRDRGRVSHFLFIVVLLIAVVIVGVVLAWVVAVLWEWVGALVFRRDFDWNNVDWNMDTFSSS